VRTAGSTLPARRAAYINIPPARPRPQGRAHPAAGDLRQFLRHSRAWAAVPRGRPRLLRNRSITTRPRRLHLAGRGAGSVDYLATSAFAAGGWLGSCQRTGAPSPIRRPSVMTSRPAERDVGSFDLGQWRIAGIGDMVQPKSSTPCSGAGAGQVRLPRLPANYGMAEPRLPSPSAISTARRA
jgi:hypothetical protein